MGVGIECAHLQNPLALQSDHGLREQGFLKNIFTHLFILCVAVLKLCGHVQAFRSCDKQGLLSSCGVWSIHHSGFSRCGAGAQELWSMGLAALLHVETSRARG